jgi:metal-sulfur cluster biosynthetic enzyme
MPDDHRKTFRVDYTVKFNLDELGAVKSVEAQGDTKLTGLRHHIKGWLTTRGCQDRCLRNAEAP